MLLAVSVGMAALVLVASQGNSEESRMQIINSLAKSLRRQLMRDNYDYSREEANSAENINIKKRGNEKKTRRNFYVSDLTVDETGRGNVNHSKDDANLKNKNDVEVIVSKKDEVLTTDNSLKFAETAQYKFLKVRRQFRRKGEARLIQEEGKDGVAIVNLAGGPVPELRLPRSGRQYMRARGGASPGDEGLPPPAVDTSAPEAAADDPTEAASLNNVSITHSFHSDKQK